MKKITLTILTAVLGVSSAFAQAGGIGPTSQAGANLLSIVDLMQTLTTRIIPLLIGVTIAVFFFMMVKYMISSDGLEKGKAWHYMMYAIVVLFVEVSIWGLVAFLGKATGIGGGGGAPIPEIPVGVRVYNPGAN